jgi:hypothetical protein
MLGVLTQAVREKQYRMKDLLEISGIFNIAFWGSFVIIIVLMVQLSIWLGMLLLTAMMTLTTGSVLAYIALLTCYTFPLASFSLAFSHILDRSEYYGLPIFILNTAFAIGGVFVANSASLQVGVKLLLGKFRYLYYAK